MTPSLKAIVERCEAVQRTVAYDKNEYVLSEFERLMPIILELLSIAEERGKALEYYANRNGEYDWPADAKECLASTTKRLEQLAGLGEGKVE